MVKKSLTKKTLRIASPLVIGLITLLGLGLGSIPDSNILAIAFGMVPFVGLSTFCLVLAVAGFSLPRLTCVVTYGLLGILVVMVPAYIDLLGPGHKGAQAGIAFLWIPIMSCASMVVGTLIGLGMASRVSEEASNKKWKKFFFGLCSYSCPSLEKERKKKEKRALRCQKQWHRPNDVLAQVALQQPNHITTKTRLRDLTNSTTLSFEDWLIDRN